MPYSSLYWKRKDTWEYNLQLPNTKKSTHNQDKFDNLYISFFKKKKSNISDLLGRVKLIVFSTDIATNTTTLQEMHLSPIATGQTAKAGLQNYISYSSKPDFPTFQRLLFNV